eukprot:9883802-Alexandrium_andersonii.AAC.1
MAPATGTPSKRPCPRIRRMSMALQAGPSKSRRREGGKQTSTTLPHSMPPTPWSTPMASMRTERVMARPL